MRLVVQDPRGRAVVHDSRCARYDPTRPHSRVARVELPDAEAYGWTVCRCVPQRQPLVTSP